MQGEGGGKVKQKGERERKKRIFFFLRQDFYLSVPKGCEARKLTLYHALYQRPGKRKLQRERGTKLTLVCGKAASKVRSSG